MVERGFAFETIFKLRNHIFVGSRWYIYIYSIFPIIWYSSLYHIIICHIIHYIIKLSFILYCTGCLKIDATHSSDNDLLLRQVQYRSFGTSVKRVSFELETLNRCFLNCYYISFQDLHRRYIDKTFRTLHKKVQRKTQTTQGTTITKKQKWKEKQM